MGERFNGIEEVVGSIPSGSTNKKPSDCSNLGQSVINQNPPEKLPGKQAVSTSSNEPSFGRVDEIKDSVAIAITEFRANAENQRSSAINLLHRLSAAFLHMGLISTEEFAIFPLEQLAEALQGLEVGIVAPIVRPRPRISKGKLHTNQEWIFRALLCCAVELLTADKRTLRPNGDRFGDVKSRKADGSLRIGAAQRFVAREFIRPQSKGNLKIAADLKEWRRYFYERRRVVPKDALDIVERAKVLIASPGVSPALTAIDCIKRAKIVFRELGRVTPTSSS